MFILLAAITVSTNFEAGSLGPVEHVTPTHLRCPIRGQADQDNRNRQANWYYFRLDGLPKTGIRLEFTQLLGEYNYRAGTHAVTRHTRPVFSYNNESWTHFPDSAVEWDEQHTRLNIRFTPTQSRIWIAHIPPYTTQHLAELLKTLRSHPDVKLDSAGRTTQGRDLPLLTITGTATQHPRKQVVWLMARQHAWESYTSWVLDAALRFLISDDPVAAQLRGGIVWKVFPMADPDGVVNGQVRFNTNGFDVNRNWDAIDRTRMAEIAAAKGAILAWLDAGHPIHLFLSLHNQEAGDYINAPRGPLGQRFYDALARTGSFQAANGPRYNDESHPIAKGRMTVYENLRHERNVPAFLMELGVENNVRLHRPRTTADYRAFGPELLQAIHQALKP